jgi:hypothetical protein
MENLKKLFDKYNFDYIYINPKNVDDLDFEFMPEEILVDFAGPPNYLGTILLKGEKIEVYFNRKITPGDVIFKYKNLKKERSVKLRNVIHNSIN